MPVANGEPAIGVSDRLAATSNADTSSDPTCET
jgi:hypothetical protein